MVQRIAMVYWAHATKVTLLTGAIGTWGLGCVPQEQGPGPDNDPSLNGCTWGAETGDTEEFGYLGELVESPGFQDYLMRHVVVRPGQQWVIEGDILVDDFSLVAEAYHRYQEDSRKQGLEDGFRGTAFCDTDLQIDQIWNPSQKLSLTYCFDMSWDDFPEFEEMAIAAMSEATLAWESAADINFIALENGGTCSHESALFVVEYSGKKCGAFGCSLGLAFIPNAENEDERILHFYEDAFVGSIPPQIQKTAYHELGHILGLYHEQARYEDGSILCGLGVAGPETWRGVTQGDPHSVMGYPACPELDPFLRPSALDRATVAYLYNLPRPLRSGYLSDFGTLVWHRPDRGEYVVWKPMLGSSQTIEFAETIACYYPNCTSGDAPYWKPVLFRNEGSVDVLMYGPGQFEERRFRGLGGAMSSDNPGVLDTSVDVPVLLDRFFSATDRSIWWIRPGHPNDLSWLDLGGAVTSTTHLDEQFFTDEHYMAVTGRFYGLPSAVFWLSPTATPSYLTYFSGNSINRVVMDKTACDLESGVGYDAIPGDYDGDQQDEIVWYDYDAEHGIYWPDVFNCQPPFTFDVGKAKLASFRVNGVRDSLMIYRPQDGALQFRDLETGNLTPLVAMPDDASPVLRDFDNNGCMDILWFAPHQPTSRLWQSNCDTTFLETFVVHPEAAYPLGYGLGHGRG